MKSARKLSFSSSSPTATVTVTSPDDQFIPPPPPNITLHLQPNPAQSLAATKIQSAYRAHLIRTLYKTISFVDSTADRLQRRIQQQDTVDTLRGSPLERARIEEELMRLLLRLDSVPGGVDQAVREGRRKVSRRIVGLQEIVDGVCCGGGAVEGGDDNWWWWCDRVEEEVCRERGGEELERYCANYLGFRCLERLLHEP
ncbi:BAG family molecular chaperone regulator 5, mitochondrial [Syzygium oleosum]|uniref:BAG family molecular chaperone regulator 5, mitochondrial n=1 Tax=Syzygium oleosum TaxID=219896 RepID=UPI0024BB11CA|nr:BAG family molecular chaperone regulator 5, mitochondrial [Syzygium oleosum]